MQVNKLICFTNLIFIPGFIWICNQFIYLETSYIICNWITYNVEILVYLIMVIFFLYLTLCPRKICSIYWQNENNVISLSTQWSSHVKFMIQRQSRHFDIRIQYESFLNNNNSHWHCNIQYSFDCYLLRRCLISILRNEEKNIKERVTYSVSVLLPAKIQRSLNELSMWHPGFSCRYTWKIEIKN